MPTNAMKANGNSCSEFFHRRRRKRQRRNQAVDSLSSTCYRMTVSLSFLRVIVAILFFRTEALHFRSSTMWQSKPTKTSIHRNPTQLNFRDQMESSNRLHPPLTSQRTRESIFVISRFAESPSNSMQEEKIETGITPDSSSSSSSLHTPDEDGVIIESHSTNATTNKTLNASTPFFATATINASTASPETADETNENGISEKEAKGERFGAVSRRDAFRYTTALASAVWITGVTFTQTDPSTKKPREPILSQPVVQAPKLEPVNLTKVASQTNVNVTLNCEKMCVSIDSSNFTFNKVERAKKPDWLPAFLAPKSQVVKKIPNTELLVAATAAGSVMEMVRTGLLYPLQTVKVRLQADRNENFAHQGKNGERPSLSEQFTTLSSNIRQKIDDGDLYAGISPTLLVSVPATGIYYGVRDVTKRLLYLTPLDSTWIAVGGALVGDVISLCFRVPSDALSTRLQVQKNNATTEAGDWLGDSFQRLPMVILTDLPYLICKIVLNKSLIQGNMSVSEYAIFAAIASIVAGFLTTPFDVARTRILLDKWSVLPENSEDESLLQEGAIDIESEDILQDTPQGLATETTTTISNPGDSVLRTMIQITKEGDGGIENLFSGWLERVVYLGIGRAWLEPIQLIGYIGIRDAVLLEWF